MEFCPNRNTPRSYDINNIDRGTDIFYAKRLVAFELSSLAAYAGSPGLIMRHDLATADV